MTILYYVISRAVKLQCTILKEFDYQHLTDAGLNNLFSSI